MNTVDLAPSLATLLGELIHGAPAAGAFVLNPGDAGLLASLDELTAAAASAAPAEGASIAAHVEHLRFGLSLMNRWAAGEHPFADADWTKAWETGPVGDTEWASLRAGLRAEAERWLAALESSARDVAPTELNGMIGSVVHLAYHLGAMRQLDRTLAGPSADA